MPSDDQEPWEVLPDNGEDSVTGAKRNQGEAREVLRKVPSKADAASGEKENSGGEAAEGAPEEPKPKKKTPVTGTAMEKQIHDQEFNLLQLRMDPREAPSELQEDASKGNILIKI